MSTNSPIAFMSYTRFDDEFEGGALTRFRQELTHTLRFLSGGTIEIFQDVSDIALGQVVQERIRQSLSATFILIPIVTPSYFKSHWCREELELFLKREQELGRHDLILSIYYQHVPTLDAAMQHPNVARPVDDSLVGELARRLAVDWRPLRGKDFADRQVRAELERIAHRVIAVIDPAHTLPPESAPVSVPVGTMPGGSPAGSVRIDGDLVQGDKVRGDKVAGDKIDARGSQGFVNRPTGSVRQRFVNTGGGDYAEGNIDKRQGAFVTGGNVHGPIIGTSQGNVTIYYGTTPPEAGHPPTLAQVLAQVQQASAAARQRGEEDLADDLDNVARDLDAALKAEQKGNASRRATKLGDAQTALAELATSQPTLQGLVQMLRQVKL